MELGCEKHLFLRFLLFHGGQGENVVSILTAFNDRVCECCSYELIIVFRLWRRRSLACGVVEQFRCSF